VPVRPEAVGKTETRTNEITPRWVLAYAASLGFTDDRFLDDARAGGPVVPPMFCACLEWTLAGAESRAHLLGLTADEQRRRVHVLQDSRFHRPLCTGMQVTTASTIDYMRDTSAGTYFLVRFEHRDAQSGDLLVTSYSGAMVRGIRLAVGEVGAPPADADGLVHTEPDLRHVRTLALDRTLPHTYSECARIWNPIHTERQVALAAGLPDIIVHGTITWALAAREICRTPGGVERVRRLSGRFRAPVVAGTAITIKAGEKDAAGVVRFSVHNQAGAPAIDRGIIAMAD
jgi:acyl dehydratase